MKTGPYRHRITFQKKTVPEALDNFGATQEDWADDFECWAAKEVAGTREFPQMWKRNQECTVRFKIRYRPNIDSDSYRIVEIIDRDASPWDIKTYDIYPPENPDGKRIELVIEATEVK